MRRCGPVLALESAAVAQPRDRLAAPAHLQLLQDVVHVVFYRSAADREVARDLLVGAALLRERQDLALPHREWRQRRLWTGIAQEVGEPTEHGGRDMRRTVHAPIHGVDQRAQQFLR